MQHAPAHRAEQGCRHDVSAVRTDDKQALIVRLGYQTDDRLLIDNRGLDGEGLVMATRSGSVDPGLVLWLEEHEHLTPHEVATALEHRSVCSRSQELPICARSRCAQLTVIARPGLALEVFVHRLVTGIGAMAAAAGGLDVLAFTGGIGERSATVRSLATEPLAFLGVDIEKSANE
jgi:acetate kinase